MQPRHHSVIDGAESTLEAMEKVPTNEKNRPLKEIKLLGVSLGWESAGALGWTTSPTAG